MGGGLQEVLDEVHFRQGYKQCKYTSYALHSQKILKGQDRKGSRGKNTKEV